VDQLPTQCSGCERAQGEGEGEGDGEEDCRQECSHIINTHTGVQWIVLSFFKDVPFFVRVLFFFSVQRLTGGMLSGN
jgi:hypothetical protein